MTRLSSVLLTALLITSVLLTQALVLPPIKVFACSCFGGPTLAEWVKLSDAIFAGKVLSIQLVGDSTPECRQKTGLYPYRKVEIEVRKAWKGIRDRRVILHTGAGGGDCGVDFEVGKEYLVFAEAADPVIRHRAGVSLTTFRCQPTALISESQQALQLLGKGRVFR